MQNALAIIIAAFSILVGAYSYWKSKKLSRDIVASETELKRRMYELSILKELGDKIGYSLNVQKIVDVITGSLNQFIDYSTVSYMLVDPAKIVFKADLQSSVSRQFIDDIKNRMRDSLAALLDKKFDTTPIEEALTGAIMNESTEPVRSFFNIPLVIGGNVMGVLTVAHTKPGLYHEEEMTILYKIVNQASQAVTQLEEVVKTEEGKLNAMVESMGDGIVMTDNDYRIAVINPAAKFIIGLPNKSDVTLFDFIDHLEGKFDIRGKLEESIALGKVFLADEVAIAGGFFQILVAPVKGSRGTIKGEIVGGVVIFHDVTKERQVEKMREQFTSMIVHELRSPLGNMKKIGEMMKEESTRQDKNLYDEYVQMFYQSSSDMLDIVNDLLDVAKLDAGKFEMSKRNGHIKEIIEDRIRFFDTTSRSAKIELVGVFGKEIPEEVLLDPLRISQVLGNLISNAIKFSRPGGKVFVQTFIHRNGQDLEHEAQESGISWFKGASNKLPKDYPNTLVVAVTDTGEGISKENMGKLFNKFEQFGSGNRVDKPKGTGLGLVIVKGIIETHGGIVGVVSEEGVGSTFFFTIKI
ncbi:MAG: GAF domain-containing protein [Candidatus Yonathbacteria bacterium]|nr:GAF domain-containing protein [Candidatus Yonathbacteria bacterium]